MNKFLQTTCVCFVLFVITARVHGSSVVPGAPQSGPIAIVGATIHPIVAEPIVDGTLLFDQGKITALGNQVELPEGTKRVEAAGKHVYPALFNASGQLGLIEINSVPATRDSGEIGSLNPSVRVETAVNPDSEIIPVTRSNGVFLTLSIPTGGLISGQSAVLQLDGWTWEDLALKTRAGMHVNWPTMHSRSSSSENAKRVRESRNQQIKNLSLIFDQAKIYQAARESEETDQKMDSRLDAMVPVLEGKTPLIIHADTAAQIRSAVAFGAQRQLRMILFGGYDAADCASLLKQHDIPVIISSVYRLPRNRSDFFDDSYTLPVRLSKLGVKFCIAGSERFGASNLRNLPYHAATAAAYGLSTNEALKAITLYPSQILGVSDRVGSLEVGKDATFIITNGNPLEIPTKTEFAYVLGRNVDLTNKQRQLGRKYRTKYERKR